MGKPNKRKSKTELMKMFPHVDFRHLDSEEDEMWFPERMETLQELQVRTDRFVKDFLKYKFRAEFLNGKRSVAVVAHSGILEFIMNGGIGDEKKPLRHCFPYVWDASAYDGWV